MKAEKLGARSYLIEMPSQLNEPDEKPYLNACDPLESGPESFLLMDFSKVRRIDGLGASMMVKLNAVAGRRRQRTIAFGMSDEHSAVFDLTGLKHAMHICRDRLEAFRVAGVTATAVPTPSAPVAADDLNAWAPLVARLTVPPLPPQAINLNVAGRRVVGPVDGFGPLWQKTYRLPLRDTSLSPESVIEVLKRDFPTFQPEYNRFYPAGRGIIPGEVVAIDSSTPGGPVSTGVMVLYADNTSFTFITPQGHPESGWVTFSVLRSGPNLVAQILGLARANDPVYELAFRTVGSKMQIKIWTHVLESLAKHLGMPADVSVEAICIDPMVRWSYSRNLWYNAQIRTILSAPVWWTGKKVLRVQKEEA